MAVLQKMRDKFGIAISIIIALSLLYFIAPMDDLMTLFGRPQNVGEITGKGITYEEFQAEVGKYTTLNEIMTGSSVQNEETQKQIQSGAWQSFVDQWLFIPTAQAAGINVGEAELVDLVKGNHISPIIAQNPIFLDDNGNFSIDNLNAFIAQSHEDETAKLYWDFLQNSIRTQQFYAKYAALFQYSSLDNALTLARAIAEGNTTADIDVVNVNYSYVPDSTISVSSSEIRKYYNSHKSMYKQEESRDIEYVVYEVTPSAEDVNAAALSFDDLQKEFAGTENVKSFLMRNSDRSYSEYWYRKGELNTVSTDIDKFAFSSAKGVSKVFRSGNTFRSAKVLATANIPDSVYVKHILLQGPDAKKQADSLCKVVAAKPAQFAALAEQYSADKGSKADGISGNIGWMTQTYMIPGMESVLRAQKNKPFVLTTRYGQHVVMVTKATKAMEKKQVAVFEKTVQPSKETFNGYYAKANKFATIAAGSYDGYLKAVDSLGVYSHKMNQVLESASAYGSVDNAREVTRWIFEARTGKASNIITVNNKYFFVAAVKAAHKEGYTPVKEVAPSIRQILYNRKRDAKQTAEIAAKTQGLQTIEEVAAALDRTVENMKDVKFSSMGAQSVEPAVLGAALEAEEGTVVGPVQGAMGTYLIKVSNRKVGTFYTEEDAKNFSSQKAGYSSNMILPVMSEEAGVKDNRARYY